MISTALSGLLFLAAADPAPADPTPPSGVRAMWIMLGVLAVLALAYRYYSRFLAYRVARLDPAFVTPAHEREDGQNYEPTNRWVLFGHHFAAISGAGPLIGPVLAIQFGYLPGLIWLVVGVCLAGAVQDMMVLWASTRRGGSSLAEIARRELGPVAGVATGVAILYVIVIALAGLGIIVVKTLGGEEVAMRAGTALALPPSGNLGSVFKPGERRTYSIPPGSTYSHGAGNAESMVFQEPFTLAVPPTSRLTHDPAGRGMLLPEGTFRLVPGSSWGTFTIAMTIPIALAVGWYMNRLRKGRIVEASILGGMAVIACTWFGSQVPGSALEPLFSLSRTQTVVAVGLYGFVAAVLPVWLLLVPRDYLSSFLKIGTIALLVLGVILVNPALEAPAINPVFVHGGGPNVSGPIFPYVFICIMCGAISGFHALVSSGTTPKMVDREPDVRLIGYGAMLMEGLVGIVALIAAASLSSSMYYDINIDLARRPDFVKPLAALGVCMGGDCGPQATELVDMESRVGESLHGRTGGAVTLAVGMARIFVRALPGLERFEGFWYHFAIMFEALFILTTIDAGTRIGRFMLQEFLGKIWKPLGDLDWWPAAALATGLIVLAWGSFIYTGSVDTIWPMFGLANQLLALIALTIVTTVLANAGRIRYAFVTLLPMAFIACTTLSAAYLEITNKYLVWVDKGQAVKGYLNTGLTLLLLGCTAILFGCAVRAWVAALRRPADVPVA
jgi:carbon starvation protein